MIDPPLDYEEFSRWRGEADRPLASARLQADAGLHNWACFSCEQAAQLALKGLLHGLGRDPRGHHLERLVPDVGEAGFELADDLQESLRNLSRHYIPTRYPDAHPGGEPGDHFGASDSEAAIRDAEAVLAFVDRSWELARGD